ncbi:hypothetical protein [Rothia sp. ZJ932]|uniref:hypothetical protein n=1 Tax=Rothia sp. ZJ932 TaxID=2810516 RepID=UPI001968851E|nr:hypothetical protein [Rothia sp. ZJ932]QRZ61544.1 hypothetical protein JR346_10110 [Rothia sp. ZJ932]
MSSFAGWKRITDAVDVAGGTIVMQIMPGRLTLPSTHFGETVQVPSAIIPGVTLHGANGHEEGLCPAGFGS